MQLTITFLDYRQSSSLAAILQYIADCDCQLLELRSLKQANVNASHLLINGNWNHIAKLESNLSSLSQNHDLGLQMHRLENPQEPDVSIPYLIETIALDNKNMLSGLVCFLTERDINIIEISSSCFPAQYVSNPLLSCKIIIAIPQEQALISFREEFLDYCDHMNIDAILEPIKNKIL